MSEEQAPLRGDLIHRIPAGHAERSPFPLRGEGLEPCCDAGVLFQDLGGIGGALGGKTPG